MVSWVVAGWNSIHVLAIELQPIKSPIHQDFSHQCLVILHDAAVGWAQIVGIPPGNFSLRAIIVQQFVVGMIAQQFRVRHSAERRPPELGLESFLVNAVHQGLHVGISMREFLGIKRPIAHIVLPTVVERDPHKSQALRPSEASHTPVEAELFGHIPTRTRWRRKRRRERWPFGSLVSS